MKTQLIELEIGKVYPLSTPCMSTVNGHVCNNIIGIFKGVQETLQDFDLLLFNCPHCKTTRAEKTRKVAQCG